MRRCGAAAGLASSPGQCLNRPRRPRVWQALRDGAAPGRPAAAGLTRARPPASRAGPDEARRRHDIIVAASLIDKVPNMGGLARTCEVGRPPRPPAHGGRGSGAPEGRARAAGVRRGGARAARPQGAARARLQGRVHDGRAVGAYSGGAALRAAGLAAAAPRRRLRARRPGAGAPPPARAPARAPRRARQRAAPAQAAEAQPLPAFRWPRRAVLVLGHEVFGIPAGILQARARLWRGVWPTPRGARRRCRARRSWTPPSSSRSRAASAA